MGIETSEAIILKKNFVRETSYSLILYTKSSGKIKGLIKGVRTPHPQFAAPYEPFTQCNITFYKRTKRATNLVTNVELINYFDNIRENFTKIVYAFYIVELLDKATGEYESSPNMYELLLKTLTLMCTDCSIKRIVHIFEIKLLKELGINPALTKCCLCSTPIDKKNQVNFSIKEGGVICKNCHKEGVLSSKITAGTLNFINTAGNAALDKIPRIKVSRQVGEELEDILTKFIQFHIGAPLRTTRFLKWA